ncbi:hypothetical protein [Streptomyces purpurascens]|uniref:hypothetical protein n=1 Tax=Streptomyces purpurascens TaxID=1924 RepID=UPI001E4EC668|nr:hypothetical protein [Streptomyces purpurascens]MCE7049066.1 hypothetical protein [Streptomyces purpurascens]
MCFATAIAPVLATVAFAVLITSAVQTTQSADTTRQAAAVRAGAAVVPRGTPGLSDAAVARAGGTALLSTTVYGGEGRAALSAAGVSPGFEQAYTVRAPRGNTVVVTAAVAAAHGWREGRTAVLTFEDGRAGRLRVTGVVDDSMPYQVFLPRELVRAHDPSALADVAYRTSPTSAPLPAGLGAEQVPVAVYAASDDAEEDRLVWRFTLILVTITAGYTMISVASTLLAATAGGGGRPRPVRHRPRPARGTGPAGRVGGGLALGRGRDHRLPAGRHGGHRPPGPGRPAADAAGVTAREEPRPWGQRPMAGRKTLRTPDRRRPFGPAVGRGRPGPCRARRPGTHRSSRHRHHRRAQPRGDALARADGVRLRRC